MENKSSTAKTTGTIKDNMQLHKALDLMALHMHNKA